MVLFLNTYDSHILIKSDNTTMVAFKNDMGAVDLCLEAAQTIWHWARERNNWLRAEYIPGALNIEADSLSRTFNDKTECSLNNDMFLRICAEFQVQPKIDLFTARNNT